MRPDIRFGVIVVTHSSSNRSSLWRAMAENHRQCQWQPHAYWHACSCGWYWHLKWHWSAWSAHQSWPPRTTGASHCQTLSHPSGCGGGGGGDGSGGCQNSQERECDLSQWGAWLRRWSAPLPNGYRSDWTPKPSWESTPAAFEPHGTTLPLRPCSTSSVCICRWCSCGLERSLACAWVSLLCEHSLSESFLSWSSTCFRITWCRI